MSEVQRKVWRFIEDNFLFRDDGAKIDDGASLLELGLIDSTGILELVAFIESEFSLQMADEDIVPANLDSIKGIVSYVERKSANQQAA